MSSLDEFSPKIVDIKVYRKLSIENKKHIMNAENSDSDSLLYVSNGFIFGQNDFPKNESIGIEYLIYGTQNNITKAIEQYGTYLLNGEIISKDEEKAITLLNTVATERRDAEQKLFLVQIILSHQSFDIHSTSNSNVNYYLAKQICKEAASLGDAASEREYAKLLLLTQKNKYGEITANYHESLKYFMLSSEKGDGEGLYYLACFYESGLGGLKIDKKKSKELFKKSAEKGCTMGMAFYGYILVSSQKDQSELEEGLRLIKFACDRGCSQGLNILGCLIERGIGGYDKDPEKAFRYFKKAASLGNPAALCGVGNFYKDALIIQKDVNTAMKYFELALSFGSSKAAIFLGQIYVDDKYGIVDHRRAEAYFNLSLDFGNIKGLHEYCWSLLKDQENLDKNLDELKRNLDYGREIKDLDTMELQGALYLDGTVVYEKNMKLGIEIYKECAELGDEFIIKELIEIYENGEDEILPDEKEAQKYRDMLVSLESTW